MKYLLLAFILLLLPKLSFGAELPVTLNCDCEVWNNFDVKYAEWCENYMREKGYKTSQAEFDRRKTVGLIERQDYVSGLMNGFEYLYINSPKTETSEYYRFPYRLREYVTEIDFYCKDPQHKNEKITDVILKVNYSLKHK